MFRFNSSSRLQRFSKNLFFKAEKIESFRLLVLKKKFEKIKQNLYNDDKNPPEMIFCGSSVIKYNSN